MISASDICLSVCLRLNEKQFIKNVAYTDFGNVNIALNLISMKKTRILFYTGVDK